MTELILTNTAPASRVNLVDAEPASTWSCGACGRVWRAGALDWRPVGLPTWRRYKGTRRR